jgi:hypothetical protein
MISKGSSGVNTTERRITPEIAASMLTTNVRNRPISRKHVTRLAEAMRRGDWELNGSTVKVAATGRLLDGQHRLSACVESGVAFDTLVVCGLPEETFSTIDQVSSGRKIADVLAIENGANMKNVAAALAVIYQFGTFHELPANDGPARDQFSVGVARAMLAKHPGVIDSVAASNVIPIWRNAQCAAVHYLFGMVDGELANDFADVMRNGSSQIRRPFNVFREGLIRLRSSSATPNRRDAAARAIKAFNAERSGRRVGILTWRSNEEFPQIDGLDYDSI